ncbi:MAG: thermonuclease family protein [Desulfovibrio sp.]|uniref:thermonuclease family protein n=1 Tax=Desulfovibrio sp. TaxID=885 RepID=UPI001A7988CB|nr:thermonuclease family protein [Desulfovibrio sp.]MBD5418326.1 thermonuclease family protein [Desulfovibrio sp.]
MKTRFLALSLMLVLAFSVTAFARSEFSGKVVRVADGDTITVLVPGNQQEKVRLYGIDCPEKGQAFGQKARRFTADRVAGRNVTVSVLDTDRYGRAVGVVKTEDGRILNQELLANGYAWLYTRYCTASFCSEWQAQEMRAKKAKAGLWADRRQWSRGIGGRQTGEDDNPQVSRVYR